jgi:hypothetical protein
MKAKTGTDAKPRSSRMLTTVGVRTAAEAEYFFRHGADEVYCGIPAIPNHGKPQENYSSVEGIHDTVELARRMNRKVFLVANDIFPSADFHRTTAMVKDLVKKGVYGVIIRDIALLDHFRAADIRPFFTLSTLAICFNRGAMDFFRERGVSRIVLPQQLTSQESAPFFRDRKGVEIEIFCLPMFYEINLNPLCTMSCPCSQEIIPGKKQVPYTCQSKLRSPGGDFTMPMPDTRTLLSTLYDLYHMGADCMKVARGPNVAEVIEVFHKTVYLMKLLEKGISRELFVHEGFRSVREAQNYGKKYIFKPLGT